MVLLNTFILADILVLAGGAILPAPAVSSSTGISARLKRVWETKNVDSWINTVHRALDGLRRCRGRPGGNTHRNVTLAPAGTPFPSGTGWTPFWKPENEAPAGRSRPTQIRSRSRSRSSRPKQWRGRGGDSSRGREMALDEFFS